MAVLLPAVFAVGVPDVRPISSLSGLLMAGAEELLARADAALYAAKRAGRNRVYVSSTQ
jgi:GGDEF domain-containing protein